MIRLSLGLPLACFFCGVDSRAVIVFFCVFVFSLVGASACFLLWSVRKGDFRNTEKAKYDLFTCEEKV